MLCFSLCYFVLFFLFSCILSLILALESGKKRVVVVVPVVVGKRSVNGVSSLWPCELFFNPKPTLIRPLTQTTSHSLDIDVIQCCCFSVRGSVFDPFAVTCCIFRSSSSSSLHFLTHTCSWNLCLLFWCRCAKETVLLDIRKYKQLFCGAVFQFWVVWSNLLTFWCSFFLCGTLYFFGVSLSVTSRDRTRHWINNLLT